MFVKHSDSFRTLAVQIYHEAKWTVRQTAHFFKISLATLYRWVQADEKKEQLPKGRKPLLSKAAQAWVVRHITNNQQIVMSKLKQGILAQFHINVSCKTLYRTLKRHGITYKRAHFHAKAVDEHKLLEFKQKVRKIQFNQIVALDESSFDTHMTPVYGWSQKGTKCVFVPKSWKGRKRFSLMMAIGQTRVIAWDLVSGSFNKVRFLDFLSNKLLPQMKSSNLSTVLMDNISFHRCKEAGALLTRSGCSALFTPPYNPDSNPIEMVFAQIKVHARRYQPETERGVRSILRQIFPRLESEGGFDTYFQHALSTAASTKNLPHV